MGRMEFAFSTLGKVFKRGYQPDTITLTTLMKGLCINNKVREALLFHDLVVSKGFRFNQVSYATLMNGLYKTGKLVAALKIASMVGYTRN